MVYGLFMEILTKEETSRPTYEEPSQCQICPPQLQIPYGAAERRSLLLPPTLLLLGFTRFTHVVCLRWYKVLT